MKVRLALLALLGGLLVVLSSAPTATAAAVVPCTRTFSGGGGDIDPGTAAKPQRTPFTINVPMSSDVEDIDVTIRATHRNAGDLRFDLFKTVGVRNVAMAQIAGRRAQVSPLTFDDESTATYTATSPAGTYRPAEPLSEHDGQAAGGTWSLYAYNYDTVAGSLASWAVTISYTDCDGDGDGVEDHVDNCLGLASADQADLDGDAIGNPCDDDVDGDAVPTAADNCIVVANGDQSDLDGDGSGDACDDDRDGDGVGVGDNCPTVPNADQLATDGDSVGDACDVDDDGDDVVDARDSCPTVRSDTASGCPGVRSALRLKSKAAKRVLTGRLSADLPACQTGRQVSVWKQRKGKDRRIDRDRSSAAGRFKVKLGRRTGRFYATVKVGLVPGAAECSAVKSRKVTVRPR